MYSPLANDEVIQTVTSLLFQLICALASTDGLNPADTLKYELSTFSPALFESLEAICMADKAALVADLWKQEKCEVQLMPT